VLRGCAASVPVRLDPHHRTAENILLLRQKAEVTGHSMLYWWHLVGIPQVAFCRSDSGDVRLPESLWVCGGTVFAYHTTNRHLFSDFFPVILTFLRQLPFIGSLLQLPYIRDVGDSFRSFILGANRRFRLQTE
jgi:hypothetical protein